MMHSSFHSQALKSTSPKKTNFISLHFAQGKNEAQKDEVIVQRLRVNQWYS